MSTMPTLTASEKATVERLASHGLLTERQATAYLLRDIEGVSRSDAADKMDCSLSTLDHHLSEARNKMYQARHTLEMADRLTDDLDDQPDE